MKKSLIMLLCGALVAGMTMTMVSCSDDDKNEPTVVNPDDPDTPDNPKTPDEPEDTTPASLTGSDYYVIVLDDDSYELISDNVSLDLRGGWQDDNGDYHGDELWIWENTYEGGTCSGLNFYGGVSEWCSLVVTNVGWSGLGWCTYLDDEQGVLEHNIDDSYYLHFAYKSSQSGTGHEIYVCGPDGTEGNHVYFGETALGSDYSLVTPVSGEYEAGEWNEYEIPMSTFGLDWSADYSYGANLVCVLSGATAGTTLDLDAVFIYKK
ncbi:MAG: hypothetical protein LUC24_07320 [Bacteroidales bacterium]|nr:hypothetical protein [Bacteroidales bacterium]